MRARPKPRSGRSRMRHAAAAAFAFAVAAAFSVSVGAASSEEPAAPMDVDAAIVLAVDSSFSVDPGIAAVQRLGHAEALRSSEVARAIRSGPLGCVAVTYVEWSGVGELRTVMPWTALCRPEDAGAAADRIAREGDVGMRRPWRGRTSLSFAIAAGQLLLDGFPGRAGRKIIDISTNGTNNDGLPVVSARDRALGQGYVINAIAVAREEPGITDDLAGYLTHSVVGGPGAFTISAEHPRDYAQALRRKLVLEISGADAAGEGSGPATLCLSTKTTQAERCVKTGGA